MNTEIEHLKRMRELLEKGWTKGVEARDASGNPIHPQSSLAVRFCLRGASIHAGRGPKRLKSLIAALDEKHESRAEVWNDKSYRTQADVLALIDRAIEIAEAAE